MKSLFKTHMRTEAGSRFLAEARREEPILGWMSELVLCVLLAIFSMIPAGLLFVAINSWSPIKIPVWILFLPGLFALTLWVELQNDLDRKTAVWRAIFNTLAYLVVAYVVRLFLSTDISDHVLRDGTVVRRSVIIPFWASVIVTWIFLTYAEFRWSKAVREARHQL